VGYSAFALAVAAPTALIDCCKAASICHQEVLYLSTCEKDVDDEGFNSVGAAAGRACMMLIRRRYWQRDE